MIYICIDHATIYCDFDWFYFTDYLLVYCFASHILQCLPKTLYIVVQLLLNQFTGAKVVIFSDPAKNTWKTLRRKPCGWRRKASIELFNMHGAIPSSSSVVTYPYCFCVAFCYCRTQWCLSSAPLLLQGHEDVSFYKAIPAWWCRSRVLLWHCP